MAGLATCQRTARIAYKLGKLTNCLEGSQPKVTDDGEDNNGSFRDLVDLGNDNQANGNGNERSTNDLKSMARCFETMPPWPLDGFLLSIALGDIAAGVGGHLHRALLGHPLDVFGSHCKRSRLSLSLFQGKRQEVC